MGPDDSRATRNTTAARGHFLMATVTVRSQTGDMLPGLSRIRRHEAIETASLGRVLNTRRCLPVRQRSCRHGATFRSD